MLLNYLSNIILYSSRKEFLENIKWRWDKYKWAQVKRIEEEKARGTYDMEKYYFQ